MISRGSRQLWACHIFSIVFDLYVASPSHCMTHHVPTGIAMVLESSESIGDLFILAILGVLYTEIGLYAVNICELFCKFIVSARKNIEQGSKLLHATHQDGE